MLENYLIIKICCFELVFFWGNIDNYLLFFLYIVLFCYRWCYKWVILWLILFIFFESLVYIFKLNWIIFKLRIGLSFDIEVLFLKDEIMFNWLYVWFFLWKVLVFFGNWFCYYIMNCLFLYIIIEFKLKV